MSYSTDFFSAIQSIYAELTGGGESKLKRETGYTIQQWRSYIYQFFDTMWPSPDVVGSNPRSAAVRDYLVASAILEWAAINELDAFDPWKHKREGPQFDATPGHGASIGAFQGYAAESLKALRDNPKLRTLVKQLGVGPASARAALDPVAIRAESRVGVEHDGIYGHGRVPGSSGTRDQADLDRRLRTALSSYDTLKDPFVSLIGKLQLSIDYAGVTMMNHDFGSDTENSHIWRLPDSVLRYVLLAFEVSGGDEGWLQKVAGIIWKADQEGGMSSKPSNSGSLLIFPWKGEGRILSVYEALQIPANDRCTYGQLVNPW